MGSSNHQFPLPSIANRQLKSHYDVFLSFRGPDTRKGFADCLYTRLVDAGLFVFRDVEELRVGEEIHSTLKEAIDRTEISIPIISKDFASSRSCLLELAHMLLRRRTKKHKIMPVFYDVNPSDLQEYMQSFEKSLEQHMEKQDNPTIETWRTALKDIGGLKLKGYYVPETHDGYQGKLIKTVVADVLQQLKKRELIVTDKLVGFDDKVAEIMRILGVDYRDGRAVKMHYDDVRVVGIWGVHGVGKTTLAKYIFNKIQHLFDACSHLPKIRETCTRADGLVLLQEKLVVDLQNRDCQKIRSIDEGIVILSNSFTDRSVLIFLDDPNDAEQVQALAANFKWFGPGSRIIVTTTARDIFRQFEGGEVKTFTLEPLKEDEALRLLRLHAFRDNPPDEADYEYDSLSIKISKETGGLPLANKVVGSYLNQHRRRKDIWVETAKLLSTCPHDKVETAIRISYDLLDGEKKDIFLDVACFFAGTDKRIASYLWRECGYQPSIGIEALHDMSLVKIEQNDVLHMHDQLRKFGRQVVEREDPHHPCRRSRLWNHDDAISTLRKRMGTESIRALGLKFENLDDHLMPCHFKGLSNLKFLKLDCADIQGDFKDVLENLRWLDWQGCPTRTSKLRKLNLKKLAVLDLSRSQINQCWKGWKRIKQKAKELKVLNLTGCDKLAKSPDFHAMMKLERLILQSCSLLSEILSSINKLGKLVSLDLRHCYLIGSLPELDGMESLEELLLDGTSIQRIPLQARSMHNLKILSACQCTMLEELPNSIGHQLTSLTSLALDGAVEISELPDSIVLLKRLQCLSIRDCKKVTALPHDIGKLTSLEMLDLSSTLVKVLPPSVSALINLKVLKMERTHLSFFPEPICNLEKLQEIDFSCCWNMEGEMPSDIMGLSSLGILRLSFTKISKLPDNICKLSNLQTIDIRGCDRLQPSIPVFPIGFKMLQ